MFEYISSPITSYLVTAAGMSLCIYLFCTIKQELRALWKHGAEKHQLLDGSMERIDAAIQEMQASLCESRLPSRPGIDRSRRTEALRMHGRGELPATIAATLGIPRNEVELALKVHRLQMEQALNPVGVNSADPAD